MRCSCRVIPVVLLLITASVSAAPSVVPTENSQDARGAGSFRASVVDQSNNQLPALSNPTESAPDFASLRISASASTSSFESDPTAILPSDLMLGPLQEIFSDPTVLPDDSMRVSTEVAAPSQQPPILVPSLDSVFLNAPELDVLLVLLLAVILYRFGAKSLRLTR